MKPGPYQSSTHGAIPLSMRGRELLLEAEAAMTRLLGGEPSEAKPKRKRAKAK